MEEVEASSNFFCVGPFVVEAGFLPLPFNEKLHLGAFLLGATESLVVKESLAVEADLAAVSGEPSQAT